MRKSKSTILIKENTYTYNEEKYYFLKNEDIISEFSKNMRIVILEEELYIKVFMIKNIKFKIHDFVSNKINDIFPQNGDILYDYEKDKIEKVIGIYSIKGGKRVEFLSKNAERLIVIPLQVIIVNIIKDKLKNKFNSYQAVIIYGGYYYYILVRNNMIFDNCVSDEIETVKMKIKIHKDCEVLYLDNNCENINAEHIYDDIIIEKNILEILKHELL